MYLINRQAMKTKTVTKINAKPRRSTNASCSNSPAKFEKSKEEITKPGHLDDKVAVNTEHKKSHENKQYNGITHEPH